MADSDFDAEFTSGSGRPERVDRVPYSQLKRGEHIIIEKRPCKIMSLETKAANEIAVTGIDIFSQKQVDETFKSTAVAEKIFPEMIQYELGEIDGDGFITLMDDAGATRDDLKLPDGDLGAEIRQKSEDASDAIRVTVLKALGEEAVISCKLDKPQEK